MRPFEHFGLRRPPFEMKPDPRFFLKSPAHVEALATLQYTVYAGKACAVVVGESGAGKTLLARVMANACGARSHIVWVDAVGQPRDRTEATVYTPQRDANGHDTVVERDTILAEWARSSDRRQAPALLIADDADVLSPCAWQDILFLLTHEVRAARSVSVMLFGLPKLLDTLAQADMTRIRRRVFRICTLNLLGRSAVAEYVNGRIKAAGRKADDLFTAEAIDSIYRVSAGNPAAINQICDNAMVNAYGDGHDQIGVADIMSSLRSTLIVRQPLLAAPSMPVEQRLLNSGSPPDDLSCPPASDGIDGEQDDPSDHSSDDGFDTSSSGHARQVARPVRLVENVEMKSSAPGGTKSPRNARTARSLAAIESRVARALKVVRQARKMTDTVLARDRAGTEAPAVSAVSAHAEVEGTIPDMNSAERGVPIAAGRPRAARDIVGVEAAV